MKAWYYDMTRKTIYHQIRKLPFRVFRSEIFHTRKFMRRFRFILRHVVHFLSRIYSIGQNRDEIFQ